MPHASSKPRTKHVPRRKQSALPILFAFCGGLMFPVLVLWVYLLNQNPAIYTVPTSVDTAQEDTAPNLTPSPLHLQLNGQDRVGQDIPVYDEIGGGIGDSMTTAFAALLTMQPSCDLFTQKLPTSLVDKRVIGYQLPEYFSDPKRCMMAGNEDMILIGAIGASDSYEGLPHIFDSIIAIPREGSPKIFYGVHSFDENRYERSVYYGPDSPLDEIVKKYPGADFGNSEWQKLYEEYHPALMEYADTSEHVARLQEGLFNIMLSALDIDIATDTPHAFVWHSQWQGSAYYTNAKGELELIDTPGYLGIFTDEETDGPTAFDEYYYKSAHLSPDGAWIAFGMVNWEWPWLRFYNVNTAQMYDAEGEWTTSDSMSWFADGRFRIDEARCGEGPTWEDCGPFESISALEPWNLQEVTR